MSTKSDLPVFGENLKEKVTAVPAVIKDSAEKVEKEKDLFGGDATKPEADKATFVASNLLFSSAAGKNSGEQLSRTEHQTSQFVRELATW